MTKRARLWHWEVASLSSRCFFLREWLQAPPLKGSPFHQWNISVERPWGTSACVPPVYKINYKWNHPATGCDTCCLCPEKQSEKNRDKWNAKMNKNHPEEELERRRCKTRVKNKYSEQIEEPYLALKWTVAVMKDLGGRRPKKETIRRQRTVNKPQRKHPKEKQWFKCWKVQNQKEEQLNRQRPKNRLKFTQNKWRGQTKC